MFSAVAALMPMPRLRAYQSRRRGKSDGRIGENPELLADDLRSLEISVSRDRLRAQKDGDVVRVSAEISMDGGQTWAELCWFTTTGGDHSDRAGGKTARSWVRAGLPDGVGRMARIVVEALEDDVECDCALDADDVALTFGPPQDHNSVVFDAGSRFNGSGTTTAGWNHTCTGTDRGLIVFPAWWNNSGETISGVTYNGVSMTHEGTAASSSDGHDVAAYSLIAPATGSNAIVVTWTSTTDFNSAAISATNVNQSDCASGFASATGTTTAVSVGLTGGATGALAVGCTSYWTTGVTGTANGGWTERFDHEGGTSCYAASHTMSGTTDTYDVTLSGASSTSSCALFFNESTAATLELEGYRFRNDDGSETTATWKAAQDTTVNIAASDEFRLRALVNVTAGDPSSRQFRLEYELDGTGVWYTVQLPTA